jgi:hypothetical protein
MSESDNIILQEILNKLNGLQSRLDTVESENITLKTQLTEVRDLNDIGKDVAKEVLDEYTLLKENGVNIKFLDKKIAKFKIRGKRGKHAKPLTKDEILDIQKVSKSGNEAARKLGVTYATYKKYAKMYGVHTLINFPPPKGIRPMGCLINPNKGKYPIEDILKCKYPDFPIHRLKDKLIRSGKKECCCEQCGFKERRLTDGKIPLLLNFEDGNKKNHSIENLRMLCYNCTFTSGRGYINKGPKMFDPDVLQDSKKILNARF